MGERKNEDHHFSANSPFCYYLFIADWHIYLSFHIYTFFLLPLSPSSLSLSLSLPKKIYSSLSMRRSSSGRQIAEKFV